MEKILAPEITKTLSESSPILNSNSRQINQSSFSGGGGVSYKSSITNERRKHYFPNNSASNSNWVRRKWTEFETGTRALICILGITFSIVVISVIAYLGVSSSSSVRVNVDNSKGILKPSAVDNENEADAEDNYGPILEIPQGKLKWKVLKSREGRDYYAFYKVPYARAPLGDLRFEPPEVAEGWDGIRFETEVAPQCIQKSKYSPVIEAVGEEDCLYMNIYVSKIPQANMPLMPTLFYIHGGGFVDGNGSRYGGKYFMDEDAVLITFQYRLGPFGFLSTEDGVITGNMGMKDQIMALKWVRDNIKYFGGDKNRILIFGNSGGGMSVSNLLISPLSQDLFQTAITQSGSSICKSTINHKQIQEKTFKSLASEVGCLSSKNTTKYNKLSQQSVLRCLREVDAKELAVVRRSDIVYAITVESYEAEDESDKFMPDSPYNMLKSGRVNKVPWIIGINSAEYVHAAAGILKSEDLVDLLNTNWTQVAPDIHENPYFGPSADKISTKAKEFYFGDKLVGNKTLANLTNLLSDRMWVHCSKVQAVMQSLYSDVYLYYLSKRPAKSYSDKVLVGYPPGDYGASHADELQYLFNYYGYPEYSVESEYYPFSRMLVKMWVDFAATGKPQSPNGLNWEPVKPDQNPISWFELNEKPHPTTVLQSRMDFWDQFTAEELCYI